MRQINLTEIRYRCEGRSVGTRVAPTRTTDSAPACPQDSWHAPWVVRLVQCRKKNAILYVRTRLYARMSDSCESVHHQRLPISALGLDEGTKFSACQIFNQPGISLRMSWLHPSRESPGPTPFSAALKPLTPFVLPRAPDPWLGGSFPKPPTPFASPRAAHPWLIWRPSAFAQLLFPVNPSHSSRIQR